MITVSGLNYEYPGKKALRDVSFSVADGSVTALVGPNGAGKTTLLRCLAAIEEPFSGRIEIAGIDINKEPRRVHRVLGYLSDFFGLYEDLSVSQSLTFAAWLHGIAENDVEPQVEKVAERLELTPWLPQKVKNLSRGWRQRVGIAQAIIHDPKILLLDEPAAGLDPEARIGLSGLFRTLQQQGMTIVVSSHILAELEDYCTNMLVLRDGSIVEHHGNDAARTGAVLRVTFARDAETYAAALSGIAGVTDVKRDDQNIRLRYDGSDEQRQAILKKLIEAGAPLVTFENAGERLQDVYLALGAQGNKKEDAHAPQS